MIGEITLATRGAGFYDITPAVQEWLGDHASGRDGLMTLFVRHTSCSLLIQENADPDVQIDLAAFFRRLVPHADDPSMSYLRHRCEGPDDMPAHIKSALLPVSLQIPVARGGLMLGTWQGLFLVEHRDAPHRRRVALAFIGG